jgi:hypothetical protein
MTKFDEDTASEVGVIVGVGTGVGIGVAATVTATMVGFSPSGTVAPVQPAMAAARRINARAMDNLLLAVSSPQLAMDGYPSYIFPGREDLIWRHSYDMVMRLNHLLLLIGLVAVIVLASGCTASYPTPPRDAFDAANVTADRMFNALNTADYNAFSENFGGPMKAAVNQTGFNEVAGTIAGKYGRYQSRAPAPTGSEIGGYNVFVYECQFEKGKLNLQITMNKTNVTTVEGFFYR